MRTPDAQEAIPLTTIQRALLVLLVLVLVLRGTFLVTLWYPQLLMTGLPASNFMRVIFLRDAAYVLTAMLGGFVFVSPPQDGLVDNDAALELVPRMAGWTSGDRRVARVGVSSPGERRIVLHHTGHDSDLDRCAGCVAKAIDHGLL